jgi:hypothetical protein
MASEQISYGTACNAKKCAPSDPIEKAAYDHGLDIFSHSTRDQPD